MAGDIGNMEKNPPVDTVVDLSATRFPVRIRYNNYDMASGMDFLALKMIQYAETRGNIDLGTLMKTFCLPEEMLPFLQFTLTNLIRHGMVNVPTDISKLKTNTPCKSMSVVEKYRDLADTGLMAGEPVTADRVLLHSTGWNQPLQNNRSFEAENPYMAKTPELETVDTFIHEHKEEYCGNLNADITSVRIPPHRAATDKESEVMKPQGFTFPQPVRMAFDFDMSFTILDNQAVSAESLGRSGKKSKDLIKNLPSTLFELGDRCSRFKKKGWTAEVPDYVKTFILPGHFISMDGLFLYGNGFSDIGYTNAKLPDFADCDAILIEKRTQAYKYWFTKAPYTVRGLEGEPVVKNVVAVHTIHRNEIDRYLDAVIADIPTGTKGLERLSRIATEIKDEELFFRRIREDLTVGNLDKLKSVTDDVSGMQIAGWKDKFEKALEDTLCHWIDQDCGMETAVKFWDACDYRNFRLSGYRFIPAMMQHYDAVEVGEWAMKNGYGTLAVNDRTYVSQVMKAVDCNKEFKAVSDIGKLIQKAGKNLDTVRKVTGITSSVGYTFDMSSVSAEDGKSVYKAEKELYEAFTKLGKLLKQDTVPEEEADPAYREITACLRIYRPLALLYSSKVTTYGPSIAKEEMGIVFCRNLMQKLEDALFDLFDIKRPVKVQMEELVKLGKLDIGTVDDLQEFLRAYETVTSGDVVRSIHQSSRQRYLDAVTAVEKVRRDE